MLFRKLKTSKTTYNLPNFSSDQLELFKQKVKKKLNKKIKNS